MVAALPLTGLMGLSVTRMGGRSPFSSHLRSMMAPHLGNGLLWLATSANYTCALFAECGKRQVFAVATKPVSNNDHPEATRLGPAHPEGAQHRLLMPLWQPQQGQQAHP